jgi:hypothetical protein
VTPRLVDPRPGRYERLGQLLRYLLFLAGGLALATVVLPPRAGRWTGTAMVVVLVGVPLWRVAWFVARWVRRGDLRYAAVGAGVLVVVAIGAALA